ncbi:hypothetical protein SDC9_114896 [bioreactor metagenome]|uniref:Uncharacterized protein n=1 Tax=bioreactor metagenome TaxID=1076179 RepID=A0A645BRB2_9ZZZZ
MVHPEEDIQVPRRRVKDNPPVGVVDPDRPQVSVPGIPDLFIVDPRRIGVAPETAHKIHYLPLLLAGNFRKSRKEIG